ncbi:XYLB [Bugula neritina]|uniref:Xylulose kinase n=1 Tax=Bugula neritina TaxID=10212 RepID=A0A7J7J2W0_BUGNE|nr:XYLB [Bugula neritina]
MAAGSTSSKDLYMGLDFSTQQLKLVVIDENLKILLEESVKFDDLEKYNTSSGCHISPDGLTVTSPTIMWVEAVDVILGKLVNSNFDFSKIKAISGSGQQHGSVFWKNGSGEMLKNLNPKHSLKSQLVDSFSVPDSPIWMDSSTSEQCIKLELAAGGAQALADITGSKAYERFTGNQILKVIENAPNAYKDTERISLVSSFGATLFCGAYCEIDESDGSGMNLFNIKTRAWEPKLIDACSKDLADKLGNPVPSVTIQGSISLYFVNKYGFVPSCQIVSFTGDNPASLAGMRLMESDIAVSLGSSDVVFLWLEDPIMKTEGHVFVNPVDTSAYMALLCFKNGSLTREFVRDHHTDNKSWTEFEQLLNLQPIGNNGNIGFYFPIAEIIPGNVEGFYYFDSSDMPVQDFSPAEHVRAIIESQFLSRRIHAENMGFNLDGCRILATGGASNNSAILQVMSDIFNAPVYTQEVANSASLGAAMIAMHAVKVTTDEIPYTYRLKKKGLQFQRVASPTPGSKEIYDIMAKRYRNLEKQVIQMHSSKAKGKV